MAISAVEYLSWALLSRVRRSFGDSRKLSRQVFRLLCKVGGVLLELSERLAHFFKLVTFHRRSVPFERGMSARI